MHVHSVVLVKVRVHSLELSTLLNLGSLGRLAGWLVSPREPLFLPFQSWDYNHTTTGPRSSMGAEVLSSVFTLTQQAV